MEPPHFIDAKDFYENMLNRVQVQFIARFEGKTFELNLNKKMSYDQVSIFSNIKFHIWLTDLLFFVYRLQRKWGVI